MFASPGMLAPDAPNGAFCVLLQHSAQRGRHNTSLIPLNVRAVWIWDGGPGKGWTNLVSPLQFACARAAQQGTKLVEICVRDVELPASVGVNGSCLNLLATPEIQNLTRGRGVEAEILFQPALCCAYGHRYDRLKILLLLIGRSCP